MLTLNVEKQRKRDCVEHFKIVKIVWGSYVQERGTTLRHMLNNNIVGKGEGRVKFRFPTRFDITFHLRGLSLQWRERVGVGVRGKGNGREKVVSICVFIFQ